MPKAQLCRRPATSITAILTATAVLMTAGCGSDGPPKLDVYPTTGTLTLDGQPFGPALVMMAPSGDQGRTTIGAVDAQGKITFTSYQSGDGAPAGSYKITIGTDPTVGPLPKPIPQMYSDPHRTPLTATIKPDQGNEVVVALNSNAGPRGGSKGVPGEGPDFAAPEFSAGAVPGSN